MAGSTKDIGFRLENDGRLSIIEQLQIWLEHSLHRINIVKSLSDHVQVQPPHHSLPPYASANRHRFSTLSSKWRRYTRRCRRLLPHPRLPSHQPVAPYRTQRDSHLHPEQRLRQFFTRLLRTTHCRLHDHGSRWLGKREMHPQGPQRRLRRRPDEL